MAMQRRSSFVLAQSVLMSAKYAWHSRGRGALRIWSPSGSCSQTFASWRAVLTTSAALQLMALRAQAHTCDLCSDSVEGIGRHTQSSSQDCGGLFISSCMKPRPPCSMPSEKAWSLSTGTRTTGTRLRGSTTRCRAWSQTCLLDMPLSMLTTSRTPVLLGPDEAGTRWFARGRREMTVLGAHVVTHAQGSSDDCPSILCFCAFEKRSHRELERLPPFFAFPFFAALNNSLTRA